MYLVRYIWLYLVRCNYDEIYLVTIKNQLYPEQFFHPICMHIYKHNIEYILTCKEKYELRDIYAYIRMLSKNELRKYICIYTYAHIYMHIYRCTYICAHICMHICKYTHIYTHIYMHINTLKTTVGLTSHSKPSIKQLGCYTVLGRRE